MARILLWLFVVVGFIITFINSIRGVSTDFSIRIVIWVTLSVLAICEAITEEGD